MSKHTPTDADWGVIQNDAGCDPIDIVMDFQHRRTDAGKTMERIVDYATAAYRQARASLAPAGQGQSRFQFALETCDLEHDYAFIVGQSKPRCPWCLEQGLTKARAAGQGEATWIVSVVMVKQAPSAVNTQNKLYELCAANPDEAQGKAIRLAQSDFPQHSFHTVCGIDVGAKRAATPSSPAPDACDIYGEDVKGCHTHKYVPCPTLDAEGLALSAPDKGEVARRAAEKIAEIYVPNYTDKPINPKGEAVLRIAQIIEAELKGQQ